MKTFTSASQRKGELGEMLVCRFLERKGYMIDERNFTRRIGEIDVIASRSGVTHFVEVKSVSCVNIDDISHETRIFRPEDQMHAHKQERLRRTIGAYLSERQVSAWQFDLACVYIDEKNKKARIRLMENLVL